MTDNWIDRLSDYVDDELAPAERRALESHLENCCECTSTLVELRAVVARAQELGEMTPEMDLWPAIAARVRETPQEFAWWESLSRQALARQTSVAVGAPACRHRGRACRRHGRRRRAVPRHLARGHSPLERIPVLSSRWPTSPIRNTTPQSPI